MVDDLPHILAIETSGRLGSVALAQGPELLRAATFAADLNHAVELLPTVDRLIREMGWSVRDIHQVYLSIGPGSFTGLRIAVTTARTLAYTAGIRLVAVPTLEVTAQNALTLESPPESVVVVLDAKRKQIYACTFQLNRNRYIPVMEPSVVEPVEFLSQLSPPRFVMGEGLPYHASVMASVVHHAIPETYWRPRAEVVHQLGWEKAVRGQFADPQLLAPIYLRLPEAEEVWRKKHEADSSPPGAVRS